MEIVIGREAGVQSPRLCLKFGNTTKFIGAEGSVPKSVSRAHCVVSVGENESLVINNISGQNSLFINGLECVTKSLSKSDLVELGPERYRLDVPAVLNACKTVKVQGPMTYNIAALKGVWEDYTKAKLDIQIRERKVGALSAIPGVISMISITLSFIEGLRAVFITVAALFALAFALVRIKSAAKVPLLQKELDEKFQDAYVCPHCSHFLGNQRYELVLRNGVCPWCKSKYSE